MKTVELIDFRVLQNMVDSGTRTPAQSYTSFDVTGDSRDIFRHMPNVKPINQRLCNADSILAYV